MIPPVYAARGADSPDERTGSNIFVNHRSRRNRSPIPNRNPRENSRVSPNHYILADNNFTQPILLDEILMSQDRSVIADNRVLPNRDLLRKKTSTIAISPNAVCLPIFIPSTRR